MRRVRGGADQTGGGRAGGLLATSRLACPDAQGRKARTRSFAINLSGELGQWDSYLHLRLYEPSSRISSDRGHYYIRDRST